MAVARTHTRKVGLVIALLSILAFSLPLLVRADGTAEVAAEAPSTALAAPAKPASALKFAYVMMHYEGTSKDDEYLLGLRVLIRSIQYDTDEQHPAAEGL